MLSVNHTPRSHWPLGRIVKVYAVKDGIVRSVKLRLQTVSLSGLLGNSIY